MEGIHGKNTFEVCPVILAARLRGLPEVLVDLGTGDGRYVLTMAGQMPQGFAVGIDTCRENLRATSRRALRNALFLIGDAGSVPTGLPGVATRITINFPWGSLLRGLLDGEPQLLHGLEGLARTGATLEVRLNAGALAEAGWELVDGAARTRAVLGDAAFQLRPWRKMEAAELHRFPTTWSKRLAFGRDPRAVVLLGRALCTMGHVLNCVPPDKEKRR